jgi:hypothetical protein
MELKLLGVASDMICDTSSGVAMKQPFKSTGGVRGAVKNEIAGAVFVHGDRCVEPGTV